MPEHTRARLESSEHPADTAADRDTRRSSVPGAHHGSSEPAGSAARVETATQVATAAPVRVIVADGDATQRAIMSETLRRYSIHPVPVGDLSGLTQAASTSAAALLDLDVVGSEPQARASVLQFVRGLRLFRPELPLITVSRRPDPHLSATMADLDVDWHFGAGEDPELIAVHLRSVVEERLESAPAPSDESAALRIDHEQRLVHLQGRSVRLSRLELKLLVLLLSEPGRVFTRNEIVEAVWKRVFVSTERTVDVVVSRLRRKLAAGLHLDADATLRTVARVGYAIELPVPSPSRGTSSG